MMVEWYVMVILKLLIVDFLMVMLMVWIVCVLVEFEMMMVDLCGEV